MNRNPMLILGATGTLGNDLVRVFVKEQPMAWDRLEMDIADQQKEFLSQKIWTSVINR